MSIMKTSSHAARDIEGVYEMFRASVSRKRRSRGSRDLPLGTIRPARFSKQAEAADRERRRRLCALRAEEEARRRREAEPRPEGDGDEGAGRTRHPHTDGAGRSSKSRLERVGGV